MAENTEKKFKEKYLAGELAFEEIDDYSQESGISRFKCRGGGCLGECG